MDSYANQIYEEAFFKFIPPAHEAMRPITTIGQRVMTATHYAGQYESHDQVPPPLSVSLGQ